MEADTYEVIYFLEASQYQTPDVHGAYTLLKQWYQNDSERQHNPSRVDLEKVSINYADLYQCKAPPPPGLPLSIHTNNFTIDDGISKYVEVEE